MVDTKSYLQVLVETVRLAAQTRQRPNNDLFLRAAYRTYLNREPDAGGRDYYLRALQQATMNRRGLLRSLMQSSEYAQVRDLPIHPLNAVHQIRMMLLRHHLPEADIIVDLGGASEGDPRGALLLMGYPYHPCEIFIVDLPPDERLLTSPETSQRYVTGDGTTIRYLYRSMANLSPIPDESVDMVFSGESIEHVSEEDGDLVCQEAFRVLKPGGYFCLDTPNAALTRLQSPDEFIHPEHKKEYYVPELREKLARWGFDVVEEKALCPMPHSLQSGTFDYAEMTRNIRLSDNAQEGYLFYLKAVKPS